MGGTKKPVVYKVGCTSVPQQDKVDTLLKKGEPLLFFKISAIWLKTRE